jgi:hypothetical protein
MKTLELPNTRILSTNIRPEMQLILCCARTHMDDGNAERIKTLIKTADIDWQDVINNGYKHGLMPLLYTNLNAIAKESVPEDAFNQLRSLFYTNAQRSLMLTGELVKILRLLQENGISAVPYKGPVLTTLLYGNVALRQFCDLDILVQRQDVLEFKKLLIAQGYTAQVQLTEAEEIAYLQDKSKHTYNFIHDSKRIMVEVHWRITPQYTSSIETKHIWKNLKESSFGGTTISTLSLENWLPILCAHASRHCWEKLSWLSDIAEIIRRNPEIDWERIIKETSDLDCKRMLFVGIYLTYNLIGASINREILHQIEVDSEVHTLASEICQKIFSEKDNYRKFMQTTLYHIRVRERWENKILYLELFLRWMMRDKQVLIDD